MELNTIFYTDESGIYRIGVSGLAVVEDGLIREWRVFAANTPVYEILAKAATR